MTDLGVFLREMRRRRKLNQKAFGDLLGVTQSAVVRYESGEISLSTSVFIRLQNIATDDEFPRLLVLFGHALPPTPGIKSGLQLVDSIRVIRERSGKTPAQFARELGVTTDDVEAFQSGRVVPINAVLRKLLPLAKSDAEKRPILKALETPEDLWDGWTAEMPASNLADFRNQSAQIIAKGKEVPAALVKILKQWSAKATHPLADAAFEKALVYLEVELGPVVSPVPQASKKKVG
jgi:transcriptional regulator with XRE-family HTH domain